MMNDEQKKYSLIALGAIAVTAAVGAVLYHKESTDHVISSTIDKVSDKVNEKLEDADIKEKAEKATDKALKTADKVTDKVDIDEIPDSVREWLKGLA